MDLDIDAFIREVHARPCLWNSDDKDYTNRDLKLHCWNDLVRIFIKSETPSPIELLEFCKQLQRRWKSLRDCYARELKMQRQHRAAGIAKTSVYIYYDHLAFLKNVMGNKESESNSFVDGSSYLNLNSNVHVPISKNDEISVSDISYSNPNNLSISIIKQENTSYEDNPYRNTENVNKTEDMAIENSYSESSSLNNHIISPVIYRRRNLGGRKRGPSAKKARKKEDECDTDRLFLLSLLTPLKKLPEEKRFLLRRKLLNLIEEEVYTDSCERNPSINHYMYLDQNLPPYSPPLNNTSPARSPIALE